MNLNNKSLDIELLKKLTKFKEVEIITNENLGPLETATFKMDRKTRDTKIKVPLWLAEELIKNGKARIPENLIYWFNQVIWKEKAKLGKEALSISKQDEKFYPNIHLLEIGLKYDKLLGLDDNARNNLKHLIRLVVNKRLEAILKAGEAGDEVIYDRLTPEERVLLKNIRNIIRNWIEYTGVENL